MLMFGSYELRFVNVKTVHANGQLLKLARKVICLEIQVAYLSLYGLFKPGAKTLAHNCNTGIEIVCVHHVD